MQPSHDLPRNFGNGGLIRIFRLFVGAAEADEALFNLELLGFGKGEPAFL